MRFVLDGITVIASLIYYWMIHKSNWEIEVTTRTMVIFFLLLIAFLWIPSIKSKIDFNQSFMTVFKAFFTTIFFSGILFLGVALIFSAINILIVSLDEKVYLHAANIIFMLLAPGYFLTLIPNYSQKQEKSDVELEETLKRSITPAKFLVIFSDTDFLYHHTNHGSVYCYINTLYSNEYNRRVLDK